ncbi:gp022 (endogenous virus) [Lactococcus phage KSY1]|uniref:Gp022 n=1 Tax=Lactococcus phage KSY1 TaxID=2913972 RepID=A6MA86_9CAUD|nr:gp022 [Lactococcus phage KSY1]ABG21564.1 gp022 [Lactococcus phage KSY1]
MNLSTNDIYSDETVAKCYVCNKHQIGDNRELYESGWLHFADTDDYICK